MIITLNSSWDNLLISISLSSSGDLSHSSFRTYSSVASFHLISCFYLYVFGKLVMFSDLGEVALGRRLATCPSNILPCGHQGYML